MLGLTFLTPEASLFVLAAAVPAAAFLLTERRARVIRALLRVPAPTRRTWLPVVIALVLLPALVAVAAAQPVVVRQQKVTERADAQAFALFDTSLSMQAAAGPHAPSRLQRAKQIAMKLEARLPDVPFGIASMTDRSLPIIMPTVDKTLFDRAVEQSVGIDRPPPSQPHPNSRATTFDAIVPLVESHFYSQGVQRRLLIVFTDGESSQVSPLLRLTLQRRVSPIFVHVWQPDERIYKRGGRIDPRYIADPTSTQALQSLAQITDGKAYPEQDFGAIARAARAAVGEAQSHTLVAAYARVALAPWFILAAAVPLAFLLYRRNA
jgi:hypothetical protein